MSLKCWCKVKEEKGRKRRYIGIIYLDQKSFFDVEGKKPRGHCEAEYKRHHLHANQGVALCALSQFSFNLILLTSSFLFSSFIFRLILVIVYLTFPSPIEVFKTEVSSLLAAFHFF